MTDRGEAGYTKSAAIVSDELRVALAVDPLAVGHSQSGAAASTADGGEQPDFATASKPSAGRPNQTVPAPAVNVSENIVAANDQIRLALRAASTDELAVTKRTQNSTGAMAPARIIAHAAELRKKLPTRHDDIDSTESADRDVSPYLDTVPIDVTADAQQAETPKPNVATDRTDAVVPPMNTGTMVGRKSFDRADPDAVVDSPATLDLALLANVERGDEVRVEQILDQTQALFDETLRIVGLQTEDDEAVRPEDATYQRAGSCLAPQNKDLRALYHLAEAVGGYETFHELNSKHAPISYLSSRYAEQAQHGRLTEKELVVLRQLQGSIREAIKNAGLYLRNVAVKELSYTEICELHDTIVEARKKAAKLDEVLGLHYMHEVEWVVERLNEFRLKMNNVERSVSGIFFVNSEVMFVPTNELVKCVNVLFEAVGNAYLARHVNGVLLLAARNLLIEVASFHSYYGKEQIYHLFRRSGSTINAHGISMRVRREIRRLFEACQRDNKLVLTRVMRDAERKFEMSVKALQAEAESIAVDAVTRLAPPPDMVRGPARRRSLLRKLINWVAGRPSSPVEF